MTRKLFLGVGLVFLISSLIFLLSSFLWANPGKTWEEGTTVPFAGTFSNTIITKTGAADVVLAPGEIAKTVKLAPTLPGKRFLPSAVWNPVNNCAYIFGGRSGNVNLDHILKYDPADENAPPIVAQLPSARYGTAAVWDPNNKCAYIFGGSGVDEIVKYVPGGTATTLTTRLPRRSEGPCAIWDPVRKCAYIFGGFDGNCLKDIVKYNPAAKRGGTATTLSATLPSGRYYTSAVWDPVRKCAYIFGGRIPTVPGYFKDIVKYDPADLTGGSDGTVTTLSVKLPSGRCGTSAVWDPVNNCAYIFGGRTPSAYFQDILKYDPAAGPDGTVITLSATLPSPRAGTSAVWDPNNHCAYIFGGGSGGAPLNDIVKAWGYVSAGSYISPRIPASGSASKWGILSYNVSSPTNTTLTIDVLDVTSTKVLASNVASGTDLSGLINASTYPQIKLRAVFKAEDRSRTPTLLDWSVKYESLP